jgi:hypothetical protein
MHPRLAMGSPFPDAEAVAILRDNDAGGWTKPSARQYPHQWNWDSALVSIGWSWVDWPRAGREIETLLRAQWDNGMIPHIRYDPRHLEDYSPGPDRWPNARLHLAPGVFSSGISNPPVLVTAARLVAERAPEPELGTAFLARVYRPLERWLRYFATDRRLDGCPLVTVLHPWETGWDNSPRWDHLRAASLKPSLPFVRRDIAHVDAKHRPDDRDYDGYLALVEMLDECDYSITRYRERSPFVVNDVFIDAAWYRAATDLNAVAERIGRRAPFSSSELEEFAQSFDDRHWDPASEGYFDYDIVSGRRILAPTPAGIAATISGIIPSARAHRMWQAYLAEGGEMRSVWTLSPRHPAFEADRYWRGPVWVNLNWLVALGLGAVGLAEEAARLRRETMQLVSDAGFFEHYSPLDGTGSGAPRFSWTAALSLDIARGWPGDAGSMS